MSLKPICFPCQRFYRPQLNGISFKEGMPVGGSRTPPGTSNPEMWKPYKLWRGDLWKCEGCGNQIIVGTGFEPVRYHHDPDFQAWIDRLGATYQVNDC